MLPSLATWLLALMPEWGVLRVFQYLTFRAVMAAMTALLIDELKNWPARAWLRYAKPFEEKRHAHHGWGVDFVRYWRIDLVVV